MRWIQSLILVGLAACGGSAGDVPNILALDGDADSGASLYESRCALCHGEDGSGGTTIAIDTSTLTDEDLVLTILDGRETMAGFRDLLSDQDVADVVAFIRDTIVP